MVTEVKTGEAEVRTIGNFCVHELAELFPPMSKDEYAGLVESIKVVGQQHRIALAACPHDGVHEGAIVDGVHRASACVEIEVIPRVCVLQNGVDLPEYVVAANMARRHLNARSASYDSRTAPDNVLGWQQEWSIGRHQKRCCKHHGHQRSTGTEGYENP